MRALRLLAAAAFAAIPSITFAQGHVHAPTEAAVDFGIFPPAVSLGEGCADTGIGGPLDPCSYKLHVLTPEETTIRKDGEVTFQFHGGGHAIAVYQVSQDTTRNELGQFLCEGIDPADAATPDDQPCNSTAAEGALNAATARLIPDGKGRVVIEVGPGGTAHPANRVWSPEGRLMSAGGRQFMNGGTAPVGADGQLVTFQFVNPGRYLVICMNRSHFLNDWMFGFVNGVGN
jgi:hypothetical protein